MISMASTGSWLAVLALGAAHGINPGMGWLFAVALGLQEGKRRAVWRALLPLALGHALAIAALVLLAIAVGTVVPVRYLKWSVAAVLLGFAVYRLIRNRHPRWGGMHVGTWDLTVWSFLMATAHGAGLMLLPFLISDSDARAPMNHTIEPTSSIHAMGAMPQGHNAIALPDAGAGHGSHGIGLLAGLPNDQFVGLLATFVHTAGYLLVSGLVAMLVFEKLGLRLLRTHWLNFDLLWACTLLLTALLTPLI
jgi:hypothetical protein